MDGEAHGAILFIYCVLWFVGAGQHWFDCAWNFNYKSHFHFLHIISSKINVVEVWLTCTEIDINSCNNELCKAGWCICINFVSTIKLFTQWFHHLIPYTAVNNNSTGEQENVVALICAITLASILPWFYLWEYEYLCYSYGTFLISHHHAERLSFLSKLALYKSQKFN